MVESTGIVFESVRKPRTNAGGFITAIHGNSAFSDADHPVKIDHYGNGAVVRQCDQSDLGVVHFPLSLVLLYGSEHHNNPVTLGQLTALEVDLASARAGPGTRDQPGGSKVVGVDLFVGGEQYWCGSVNESKLFTVRVADGVKPMELLHPKGIGVTLKIKWGADALQFRSVAFFGEIVQGSSGVIRPE